MKEVHDIKGVCALPLPACCGINVRWKEVKKQKPQKKATTDKQVPEGPGRLEGEMPSLIQSSWGEVGVRQWERQWRGDSTDPEDGARDAGLQEVSTAAGRKVEKRERERERGSPIPHPLSPVTEERRAWLLITTHRVTVTRGALLPSSHSPSNNSQYLSSHHTATYRLYLLPHPPTHPLTHAASRSMGRQWN